MENESMDGIVGDIVEGFEKVLRPKNAKGETEPMGTVKVNLTNETKVFIAVLGVGGILLVLGGQALIKRMN